LRKGALSAETVAIPSVAETCQKLTKLLKEAVEEEKAPLVLLSGGLDTSIIALLAKKGVKEPTGLTIAFDDESEDLSYARRVARFLSLKHEVHYFDCEELREAMIKVSEYESSSFASPGLTTLASTYLALRFASSLASEVLTGDGADELLFGYSSLINFTPNFEAPDIFTALDNDFPRALGEGLGIKVCSPFLSPEVVRFGQTIPLQYKVRREEGKLYGKWILRKAFQDYLPREIVWREKVPFDRGCGVLRCAQGFFQAPIP
jgi:asparagine synthase (glutamine-hydrolysing)